MRLGHIFGSEDNPLGRARRHLGEPVYQYDASFNPGELQADPPGSWPEGHFLNQLAAQNFGIEFLRGILVFYRYRDDRNFMEHSLQSYQQYNGR